jgi:Flp pilus assembly protein TadD
VNRALEQAPDAKRFLDTRGHIHAALKNWSDAVSDLERTMPEFSNNPRTHSALADCYENLGNKLLADQHRKIAQQLGGPVPAEKRPVFEIPESSAPASDAPASNAPASPEAAPPDASGT